jgi:PTH1 family peptidyl-tRNA hydrolase
VGIGSHIGYGSQVDFVLGKWTPEAKPVIDEACKRAISALKSFAMIGIDKTMSEFNKKPAPVIAPAEEKPNNSTEVSQ